MAIGALKTRLFAACVAVALTAAPPAELTSVMLVFAVTVPITVPSGMPAPLTDMPAARPAVLATVTVALPLVVPATPVRPIGAAAY